LQQPDEIPLRRGRQQHDTRPGGHGDVQLIGPLQDMTFNGDLLVDPWSE